MSWRTRAARPIYAAKEGVLALVVALILTTVVLALGYADTGGAWSQRIFTHFGVSPLNRVEWREGVHDLKFVFLDVGLKDCHGRAPAVRKPDTPLAYRAPCRPTDPLYGASLAQIIRQARDGGAALVIVDVLVAGSASTAPRPAEPPASAQDAATGLDPALRREFDRDVAGPGESPVLVGWMTDLDSSNDDETSFTLSDADEPLLQPGSFRHARFLPSMITGMPVAHKLLPAVCLVGTKGQDIGIPTLAAGAALVAATGKLSALAAYPSALPPAGGAGNRCAQLPGFAPLSAFANTERVFSVGPVDPERRSQSSQQPARDVAWFHRPWTAGSQDEFPNVRGAIVLIGSADEMAGDLHWTDLQAVSGGEIILNDVRQFLLSRPAPAKDVWDKLRAKTKFFLAGAVAVFLAAWAVPHHRPVRKGGVQPGRIARWRWLVWHFVAKLLATAAMFIALLWLQPHELHSPPDFITPFIALLAENFADLLVGFVGIVRQRLGLEPHHHDTGSPSAAHAGTVSSPEEIHP